MKYSIEKTIESFEDAKINMSEFLRRIKNYDTKPIIDKYIEEQRVLKIKKHREDNRKASVKFYQNEENKKKKAEQDRKRYLAKKLNLNQ